MEKFYIKSAKQMETGKGVNVLDDADSCCGCSCSIRCLSGSCAARSGALQLLWLGLRPGVGYFAGSWYGGYRMIVTSAAQHHAIRHCPHMMATAHRVPSSRRMVLMVATQGV